MWSRQTSPNWRTLLSATIPWQNWTSLVSRISVNYEQVRTIVMCRLHQTYLFCDGRRLPEVGRALRNCDNTWRMRSQPMHNTKAQEYIPILQFAQKDQVATRSKWFGKPIVTYTSTNQEYNYLTEVTIGAKGTDTYPKLKELFLRKRCVIQSSIAWRSWISLPSGDARQWLISTSPSTTTWSWSLQLQSTLPRATWIRRCRIQLTTPSGSGCWCRWRIPSEKHSSRSYSKTTMASQWSCGQRCTTSTIPFTPRRWTYRLLKLRKIQTIWISCGLHLRISTLKTSNQVPLHFTRNTQVCWIAQWTPILSWRRRR